MTGKHFGPLLRSLLALWLLALPAAAASQAAEHRPVPLVKGTTVRISEHVYLIPDERVPMVPNVGIVVGRTGTLVIDPGMGLRSGQAVLRVAQKVSQGGALYIANTHYHTEHTTGEIAFPASARVIRAASQQQELEALGMQHVARFAKMSEGNAELLRDFPGFRAPAEVFEREKTLDLGGVRVRMLELGPGHTRGDTVFFVEGDRVLFSGDLAMRGLFSAFGSPQSSGRAWLLAALDRLDGLRPRVVIGAHYPVADASAISDYRGYFLALQARVTELKRAGHSPDDVAVQARSEFAAKYKDWAQPLRVHTAATVFYRESDKP